MPLTDDQYRKAAIAHINQQCKKQFAENDIPPDIEIVIDLLIKSMKENKSVASQSLGDMSKSFFQGATYDAAIMLLKPYKKARFF